MKRTEKERSAMRRVILAGGLALGVVMAAGAQAEEVSRRNWLPDGGNFTGSFPVTAFVGDVWTFHCPAGGTATLAVDTTNDDDGGNATLDPRMTVVDGQGNEVATGDDEFTCSFAQVCGWECPLLTAVSCGTGEEHSIYVYDAEGSGSGCTGGGYVLSVQAFESDATPLTAAQLQLGGAPAVRLLPWTSGATIAPGPAIDDGALTPLATSPSPASEVLWTDGDEYKFIK